ncbi:hypothetical protein L3Q82_000906 [Scortum barcoo]|uniref:Uncharacterized protein n=1 Tax=Scortum barcoo TaxID=214431 RepID=A0ACB8WAN0_9TELE|nr:hypothetical protein L3Q82_000906 [Scortum barcoo]
MQLKKIKARKATGPDGISSRLLRDCADQLCQVVCYIFNLSLSLERVPVLWKTSCVVPVPKTSRPKELQPLQTRGLNVSPDEGTGEDRPQAPPPPGDSLSYHSGQNFSTFDKDQDSWLSGNCAKKYLGAFWYNNCHSTNPNGVYRWGADNTVHAVEVEWYYWKSYDYSLKSFSMKIRPCQFDCQQLPVTDVIIGLRGGKASGKEGMQLCFRTLPLRQHGPYSDIGGVHLHHEF